MATVAEVHLAMVRHLDSDLQIITHMFSVHGFAVALAASEGMQGEELLGLEIAALTHCIGIKECSSKYHILTRKGLEVDGTRLARELLQNLGFTQEITERACFILAHHLSYADIQNLDHQIFVEAFFLATAKEKEWTKEQVQAFCERVFKTKMGFELLGKLYAL